MQAGHALAAAAEGVGVHHIAAFLVLLLPGAYVALDTETLAVLSPLRELRARAPLTFISGTKTLAVLSPLRELRARAPLAFCLLAYV
jgi:hypothetical protein